MYSAFVHGRQGNFPPPLILTPTLGPPHIDRPSCTPPSRLIWDTIFTFISKTKTLFPEDLLISALKKHWPPPFKHLSSLVINLQSRRQVCLPLPCCGPLHKGGKTEELSMAVFQDHFLLSGRISSVHPNTPPLSSSFGIVLFLVLHWVTPHNTLKAIPESLISISQKQLQALAPTNKWLRLRISFPLLSWIHIYSLISSMWKP